MSTTPPSGKGILPTRLFILSLTFTGAGSNLPSWFTNQFTTDLLSLLTTVTQQGDITWQYEKFDNTYKDPAGKDLPTTVNAIITYANGSLREDGQSANESILYYKGVYYHSHGFGHAKSLNAFLGGSVDPPAHNYPIIQIGIATGTVIVASALAVYIVRAAPPVAGVTFSVVGTSLKHVLFKWPWQSALAADEDEHSNRQSQDHRKERITNGSSYSSSSNWSRLEAAVQGIDVTWVENLLKQQGFEYKMMPATSDAQTTAESTLLIRYVRPPKMVLKKGVEDEKGAKGAAAHATKG